MDIRDKVVLVTGAPSSIGKATAELFSKKGARVVLAARSPEEVKELTSKIPDSLVVAVDMSKPQEVQSMIQQTQALYGRIDVLINHAAHEMQPSFDSLDLENPSRYMTSNIYGPLAAMLAAIPLMQQQGGGAIVNISSGVLPAVHSKKHDSSALHPPQHGALNTRTEYTGHGISVSHVYPCEMTESVQNPKRNPKKKTRRQSALAHSESLEMLAEQIIDTVEKGIDVEFS